MTAVEEILQSSFWCGSLLNRTCQIPNRQQCGGLEFGGLIFGVVIIAVNYLSFGYKTDAEGKILTEQFHMYAGKTEQFKERVLTFEKRNVLKFASIYGANESGKSNLVKAIECGRKLLLNTVEQEGLRDKYCRSKRQIEICLHSLNMSLRSVINVTHMVLP